jgi:rod shape-determining protein MreD
MSRLVKNMIRFALFVLVQALILNNVPPLHRFITPYLYFLFLLWMPFNISRPALLFTGLALGFSLDFFTKTYGLHAAPCVLIAYLRPFVINVLINRRESTEFNYVAPSITSMGWVPYIVYVLVLTAVHHGYLVMLEWLNFAGNFWYFIVKVLATTGISFGLIIITELVFPRRQKYRTNTA